MIALLLSLLPVAPVVPPPAPDGLVELVTSHPGYEAAEFGAAREDLLAALEADPEAPWAALALAQIDLLEYSCPAPIEGERLLALVGRVTGPAATIRLRRLVQQESRRRRFSARPLGFEEIEGAGGEDLWHDFVREWRWIGPLGDLEHPAPLRAPAGDGPASGPRDVHRASWGEDLTWRPLRRERNELYVDPARQLPFAGAGVGYLAAFVECAERELTLEILCGGNFQAYWNGDLATEVLARGLGENQRRFVVDVRGNGGWNGLVLRFPNDGGSFSARVLTRAGRPVAGTELDADVVTGFPETPSAGPPAPRAPRPPGAGLERVAWMMEQAVVGRADRALAVGRPDDPAALRPWLRARHDVLQAVDYLPNEVQRRLQLEVESEMEATGGMFPSAVAARASRLAAEDKPAEALALFDELVAAHPRVPTYGLGRSFTLERIDPAGVLSRLADLELAERFPELPFAHARLASGCEAQGDLAGALEHYRRALEIGGNQPSIQLPAFALFAEARGEHLAWSQDQLARWRAEEPGNERPRRLQVRALEAVGDDAGLERHYRAAFAERPHLPRVANDLANFLAARGRAEEARELYGQIVARRPGSHAARGAMALYGIEDPAERFFAEFAPDRDEALAATDAARDASVAEMLDSGLVYLYPDGSSRHRMHTISLALDRKGTELLHEQAVAENTRLARVLKADGSVVEPVEVQGSWVMPSLDAGDAVELVWEEFRGGLPGVVPDLGWWRFASFEKPFVRSRYVLFVPDGLPGSLETFHFDGERETVRWEGGTVHVLQVADRARQKEEPLRPSYEEILPWLQYGADGDLAHVEAVWRDRVEVLSRVPADIELELERLVDEVGSIPDPRARAEAIHARVTERVLDFQGGGYAAQTWAARRGDPVFLLGTLFERAGLEVRWAVLETGVAPELDPNPAVAFENVRGWGGIALVAELDEPAWIFAGTGRGARLGTIPVESAGARVLFLDREGAELGEVPRSAIEDVWDSDLALRYVLGADGAASVTGTWRMTSAQGPQLREQVSQVGEVQRGAFARNLVGNFVPGLDLTDYEFVGLAERGGPLELAFEGRIPGFARAQGGEFTADLRLPPTQLSTGLGAAQRTWPLALRVSQRDRVRVRLVPGESWSVVGGPAPFAGERDGFSHTLEVSEDGDAREWRRTLLIRGPWIPADELGAFLQGAAEREREESRAVRLERR